MSLPENRPIAGGCSNPIRLSGHVDHVDVSTGEVRRALSGADLPGGVLHVRCNNRRASACPACSRVYQRDARRLVLAGMTGGKDVPESVAEHPAWFMTLTAPSFGPVHSRRQQGGKTGRVRACHPRRGTCPHGKPAGCHERHHADDSRLGSPICAKYVTKSAGGGALDHPVRSLAALGQLTLPPHVRRLVETCWRLGHDETFTAALDAALGRDSGDVPRLLRWAHQFGFGGHWLTKSRRYSTTFGALRTVRRVWSRTLGAAMAGRLPEDAFGRTEGDPDTVVLGAWAYAGRGLHHGRNGGDDPPGDAPVSAAGGLADVWRAGL